MTGFIASIGLDGIWRVKEATRPTLDLLQEAVGGGSIETVPFLNTVMIDGKLTKCMAFCDEEGKIKGQLPNAVATRLWDAAMTRQGRGNDDLLVGTICIVWGDPAWMRAL